jgi:hypothetical protein
VGYTNQYATELTKKTTSDLDRTPKFTASQELVSEVKHAVGEADEVFVPFINSAAAHYVKNK